MTFKINISEKSGKTYKLESEAETLVGKQLHDKLDGKDINSDLEGYEFEIAGASDKAGFTAMENVEGIGLKKVLLTYGKGMKKCPRKEGKKKTRRNKPKGLRLRKTVRGKVISNEIVQINLKVLKDGAKKLSEIFPDQCKEKTKENRKSRREKLKTEEKSVEPEQSPKETESVTEEKAKPEEPHDSDKPLNTSNKSHEPEASGQTTDDKPVQEISKDVPTLEK